MLNVIQPGPERTRPVPLFERTAKEVEILEGFYYPERDDSYGFRWMKEEARLGFRPEGQARFLELPVYTDFLDLSHELTLEVAAEATTYHLETGWSLLSHPIPAGAEEVKLSVNKIYPRSYYPNDSRTLTIRIGDPRLHADVNRHRDMMAVRDNRILNFREMQAGKTMLESTPPSVGIDLHGVCNVKPPCVYCDWDASKELEGDFVDVPFTRETVEGWGPFFDNAASLVNCGIGEPFMMKNLDELFDIFGEREKMLEMATNGQILTDRNIERLVGRKVRLFVSLDAATPETYAKLRNDKLPKIIGNLRRLSAAKGGRGRYPMVFLVFMPMKVNVHELEEFVKLCAELDVDQLVLRPLNYSEDMGLDWERAGHHFVYQNELLPFDELVHVSGRAAELCRQYGVNLSDLLDFGDTGMEEYFPEDYAEGRREVEATTLAEATPDTVSPAPESATAEEPAAPPVKDEGEDSLGDPRLPICVEPWKNFYILRRGVLPCCYGHYPLEPMDRWEGVWNSPELQEIRSELAAGRLHSYCLESKSCPIVRKRQHGGDIPLNQALPGKLHRLLHRIDRLTFGIPRKVYRGLRGVLPRSHQAHSNPG